PAAASPRPSTSRCSSRPARQLLTTSTATWAMRGTGCTTPTPKRPARRPAPLEDQTAPRPRPRRRRLRHTPIAVIASAAAPASSATVASGSSALGLASRWPPLPASRYAMVPAPWLTWQFAAGSCVVPGYVISALNCDACPTQHVGAPPFTDSAYAMKSAPPTASLVEGTCHCACQMLVLPPAVGSGPNDE